MRMLYLFDLEAIAIRARVHWCVGLRGFQDLLGGPAGQGLDASRIHQLVKISVVEFDHHSQNHHPLYSDSGISIVGCHDVKAFASRLG